MINWGVRLKNKAFWQAIIPAMALVIQAVAGVFGFVIDLTTMVGKIVAAVDAVFAVLVICGIVNDPTVDAWSDSSRAMTYHYPAPNCMEEENIPEG